MCCQVCTVTMANVKIPAIKLVSGRKANPLQAWTGSQISRQSAHEGGKVVSPRHRPPLHPGNIPGTYFCYRLSSTGPQGGQDYVIEKFQWQHQELNPQPSGL